MKLPVIRESYFLNIVILIVSLFVSWFTLLFGLAHIYEAIFGPTPFDYKLDSIIGAVFCIGLCIVGVAFLLIAIASIQGILYKIKKKQ